MHRLDARIKCVVLLIVSISVFLVSTWAAEGLLACFVVVFAILARARFVRIAKLSIPLLIILAIIVVCNSLTFDAGTPLSSQGGFGALQGIEVSAEPLVISGLVGISLQGCVLALGYALRILIVFVLGYVITCTTTAEALMAAIQWFLSPLRAIKVPVDDIAMVLSLALRFIPLMALELNQLRQAQEARGAQFVQGGLWKRVSAWMVVLIPLVVALYRRATTIALAMESRCYGARPRSVLNQPVCSVVQLFFLVALVLGCGALAVCA